MINQDVLEKILRRGEQMRGERQPHEHVWKKCYDLSFPERGENMVSGTGVNFGAGNQAQKSAEMIDSTGRNALQTWIAGVIGGVTPSNQQWADLDAGRESEIEKHWLSEAARTIWENIHASNYDAEILDGMSDFSVAGWFVLYVDEAEEGGYQFEAWPITECFYAQSRKSGPVDILHRYYACTVEQLVAQYGMESVSPDTRTKYRDAKYDEKIQVVRVIHPRYNSNGVLALTMPYESLTVECGKRHVLLEGGYHEFPCIVPRWRRLPNSVYAVGPFLDAYADCKTLNTLGANELASTDLAVGGLWIAKADGVLNPGAIRIGPRKVIVAADTDNLKALQTGADFNVAWTVKQALQAQIRHTLMADQLEPQDKPQMTAFEVHTRIQMIRQRLGPIFGRFQAEFLTPLIERCFGIAYRANVLGDAPESLLNRAYTVKYKSPLARAQMQEDVTAIEATVQSVGLLASAKQDESVWDVMDTDEAIRLVSEGRGVPAKLLRKKDDVDDMRAARAEALDAKRQEIQQQEMGAEMMKKQTVGA